jgi:hypothetical protein
MQIILCNQICALCHITIFARRESFREIVSGLLQLHVSWCKEQTLPKTKSAPHLLVHTTKTKFHRNLLDNLGILNVDHITEQDCQKRSQN